MATHYSILAWRIPWTEEPKGCKESDMTKDTCTQLIYNVVLDSIVQKSYSVIHRYILFFIFFSIMADHRILTIVPSAIQQDLVVHPPYVQQLQLKHWNQCNQSFLSLSVFLVSSYQIHVYIPQLYFFRISYYLFLLSRLLHQCLSSLLLALVVVISSFSFQSLRYHRQINLSNNLLSHSGSLLSSPSN